MTCTTVTLDRDGVINRTYIEFIKSPADWQPLPGSLEALVRLKHAGLRLVVAANHSGPGEELLDYETFFATHDKLTQQLAELGVRLDGIFFCPHTEADQSGYSNLQSGLLSDVLRRWNLQPPDCLVISNSPHNIDAARTLAIPAIGVLSGHPINEHLASWSGIPILANLSEAVDHILKARQS